MGLFDPIRDVWRRAFGRWWLEDPRPYAQAAPYTFNLPLAAQVAALEVGDDVKLIFDGAPASRRWGAERMWVKITRRDGERFEGTLNNVPADMPQLKEGTRVPFEGFHVIDIEWADPAKYGQFDKPDRDWVYGRCLVDEPVIRGEARVGYLYRETPDLGGPEDKYPDTGWRLRAQWGAGESDADYDARKAVYVAIGLVLNHDASIEPLLAEPVGSRFERKDGAWARMAGTDGE